MKQIHKEYEQSFLLEPTKLTRLIDKIHERLADQPHTIPHDHFEVFLTGNRREEMTNESMCSHWTTRASARFNVW